MKAATLGRRRCAKLNPRSCHVCLAESLLDGRTTPVDLLASGGTVAAAPHWGALEKAWTVEMGAGEMRFFSGFTLGVFAPRTGKKGACTSHYEKASNATTLQGCFLDCARDAQCENVLLGEVAIAGFTAAPPPVSCKLLGVVAETGCTAGASTLVTRLPKGRECWGRWAEEGEVGPLVPGVEEAMLPAMGPGC